MSCATEVAFSIIFAPSLVSSLTVEIRKKSHKISVLIIGKAIFGLVQHLDMFLIIARVMKIPNCWTILSPPIFRYLCT
jgi:hypothetical protein